MTKITDLLKLTEAAWDIVEASKDPNLIAALRLLHERLINPQSFIVFAGETSSGKSTLINSWLKRKLLASSARPTTGTVTWIQARENIKSDTFLAIYTDTTVEEIEYQKYDMLSQSPSKDILRLKIVVNSPKSCFNGMNVFDTPGYNSLISEHEEVLKNFLPESDVVVFIVNYRVGFGMNDQELMELVGNVSETFSAMPVILVINRCPSGISAMEKRIKEIKWHAEDSLHRKTQLIMINSSMPDTAGNSTIPDADQLWDAITVHANSEERIGAIFCKSKSIMNTILVQCRTEAKKRLDAMSIDFNYVQELEDDKTILQASIGESYKIIDKYMDRLEREIPRIITQQCQILKDTLTTEAYNTNKWTEARGCTAYIISHFIPFKVKGIARTIEDYVKDNFKKMDEELSERANKSIHALNSRAECIESPELSNLIRSLAINLAGRIGGNSASSLVNGLGGACGSAAGLGNLAKMCVSNLGKLLGRKFGREVYIAIGKIFTKRMVTVLTAALQVVIDAGIFIYEAHKWQGKLVDKACKALDEWEKSTLSEVSKSMIPEYSKDNKALIDDIYIVLLKDIDGAIEVSKHKYTEREKNVQQEYIKQIDEIILNLENIK